MNLSEAPLMRPEMRSVDFNFAEVTRYPGPHTIPIGWLLLVPLFYFAGHGGYFFDWLKGNSQLALEYQSMVATTNSHENALELMKAALNLGIIAVLVIGYLSPIIRTCREHKAVVLLTILTAASAAWSQSPITTIHYALYLFVDVAFAFYLVRRFQPGQQMQLFQMLGWVVMTLTFVLAIFFPQYGIDHRQTEYAWQGMFSNKNSCAQVIAMLIPAALFDDRRGSVCFLSRVLFTVAGLVILALTKSRTGWVMGGVVIAFWVFSKLLTRVRKRERILSLFAGVFLAAIVAAVGAAYAPLLLGLLGKDASLTGRLDIWKSVIGAAMKRVLLGYGYHAFWTASGGGLSVGAGLHAVIPHSHNGFLDVWLETGIVGLGLTLYLVYMAVRNALKCICCEPGSYVGWYAAIVLLTVVCNLDEHTLLAANYVEWLLFIIAYVGLADAVKRTKAIGLGYPPARRTIANA